MGVRLEYVLITVIAVVTLLTMTTKLTGKKAVEHFPSKELEFTDTTFTEVTTQKRTGIAYGTHGVRINGVLTIDNLRYHNESIKSLLANRGTYKGKKIYLDGNVSVHQKEAHDYYTEHAIYDQKEEILYVTSPFVAYVLKHIIRGNTLRYNTKNKEVFATAVDALIETEKGEK